MCSMMPPGVPNMSIMPGAGGAPVATAPNSSPGPAPNSPYRFVLSNEDITRNPAGVSSFTTFVSGVPNTVENSIENRVRRLFALFSRTSTNRGPIMEQLTGLTRLQGRAIETRWNGRITPTLRTFLDQQLRSYWSTSGTDNGNVNEALNSLDGNASEAGFSALTAAFNWTNEYSRARLTLLNMTPQQIADMRRDHGAELDAMANQLVGNERLVFQALIDGNPALARAIELRARLDSNNYKTPEARGFANADAIDAALAGNSGEAGLAINAGSRGVDVFNLEDPAVAAARLAAANLAMQNSFATLPGVPELSGATSTTGAGSTLLAYATRTVDHNMDWYRLHPPPPGSPGEAHMRSLQAHPHPYARNEMAPAHKNMILQSITHGPSSDEAHAARLYAESLRSGHRPNAESMDSALHMGSGDATTGGGYDAAARARGLEEANRRRARIFLLADQYRASMEPGYVAATTAAEAQARVRAQFVNSYPNDERSRAVILGMIDSEEGNLAAVVELAAHTENATLLTTYLGRRDRREIEAFTAHYNSTHSVSLEKRLGLFEHHWSIGNMNGAVFSGDTANALTLAWKGVPQNTKERSEVALLRTTTAIDQAGWLGRRLASREFELLEANAAELRAGMGVTAAQVDQRGDIRTVDPVTGLRVNYGHFDERGELRQEYRGDSNPLEVAMGMSSAYVDNYNAATDRMANFLVTALVIAAAVITTALTGGAAASLWIPMLVTAGAGLVGIGLSASIKGGRYGRDELVRDIAMTVITTLTAGIGSAGGVFARGAATGGMRGGMTALRLVARRGLAQGLRISEAGLERSMSRLGMRMAASGHWAADIGIGAVSGALNSGVGAAFDPTNRGEGYWDNVWSAAGRGLVGGGLGAVGTRGVMAVVGRAGQGVAGALGQRSANSAVRAGLSTEAAMTRALVTMRRVNWVSGGIGRSLGNATGNALGRIGELGLDPRMTWDQVMSEARLAFVQGLVQGAMEHAVDPGNHNPFRARHAEAGEAELRSMTREQRADYANLVQGALGMVMNAPRPQAATGGTDVSPSTTHVASANGAETPPPAPKSAVPVDADGAEPTPRPHESPVIDETPVTPRAARDEGGTTPTHPGDDGPGGPRLQSALGADEDTKPNRLVAVTVPAEGIDLTPGAVGPNQYVPQGSVLRATDPSNPLLAVRNYLALMEASPYREALIAFNQDTNTYLVIQGGPGDVTPPPAGYITLRHSHPAITTTDNAMALTAALPSGLQGDVMVLRTEVDALHARAVTQGTPFDVAQAQKFTRSSAIDITINGQPHVTTFQITRSGDNYAISVNINPAVAGVSNLGPFAGNRSTALRLYAEGARDAVGAGPDFGLQYREADAAATSTGLRNRAVSEGERANATFAAQRMAQAADFALQSTGAAPRGILDPILGRQASMEDAHNSVRAMGLVGTENATANLTRILNDSTLSPEVRAAVADAVLQATRIDMIRNGTLGPGDDVVMLFRGVTAERMADYEREGINLGRLPDDGRNEDAGRGLYGSQDMLSAMRYMGEGPGGTLLPLITRASDLGRIIDVRSGTPLGDRWLAFLRTQQARATEKHGYDHLNGVLFPGFNRPFAHDRDLRGRRYEEFLRQLAADESVPAELRAAAADPHITLMDLGGVASTGNDRGILTDQWAMHSQRIANMFNVAHNFPVPGTELPQTLPDGVSMSPLTGSDGTMLPPARMRSALTGDDTSSTPIHPTDTEEAPTTLPPVDPATAMALPAHALPATTGDGTESPAAKPVLPPATLSEAVAQASNHQRRVWQDAALAAFAKAYPDDYATFMTVMGSSKIRARMILSSPDGATRDRQFWRLGFYLVRFKGMAIGDAMDMVRLAVRLANGAHASFDLIHRHVVEQAIWADRLAALPVALRTMAEQSNLVLYLAAHEPGLLQKFHTDFLGTMATDTSPARFEDFVARALIMHPTVQAKTQGRRIQRFTTEADFNAAAKTATPLTRYEFVHPKFGRLAYTTDHLGRVVRAEGVPLRIKGARSSSQTQADIGNSSGISTDVGFHLIAHIFGAVVNELTVVAGNGYPTGDGLPNLNGSAYKVEFENIVRRILDTTSEVVEIEVVPVYNPGNTSKRPDRFEVRFRSDASFFWNVVGFDNKF